MIIETWHVNDCVKLILGVIQLMYLDRKPLLDLKLVQLLLDVIHIFHNMLK